MWNKNYAYSHIVNYLSGKKIFPHNYHTGKKISHKKVYIWKYWLYLNIIFPNTHKTEQQQKKKSDGNTLLFYLKIKCCALTRFLYHIFNIKRNNFFFLQQNVNKHWYIIGIYIHITCNDALIYIKLG